MNQVSSSAFSLDSTSLSSSSSSSSSINSLSNIPFTVAQLPSNNQNNIQYVYVISQPTQSIQQIQPTQSIQQIQPTQPTQLTQPNLQTLQTLQTIQSLQAFPLQQSVLGTQSISPSQPLLPVPNQKVIPPQSLVPSHSTQSLLSSLSVLPSQSISILPAQSTQYTLPSNSVQLSAQSTQYTLPSNSVQLSQSSIQASGATLATQSISSEPSLRFTVNQSNRSSVPSHSFDVSDVQFDDVETKSENIPVKVTPNRSELVNLHYDVCEDDYEKTLDAHKRIHSTRGYKLKIWDSKACKYTVLVCQYMQEKEPNSCSFKLRISAGTKDKPFWHVSSIPNPEHSCIPSKLDTAVILNKGELKEEHINFINRSEKYAYANIKISNAWMLVIFLFFFFLFK